MFWNFFMNGSFNKEDDTTNKSSNIYNKQVQNKIPKNKVNYTIKDIVAIIIAAFQVLLPVVLVIALGYCVIVWFIVNIWL